MKVDEMKQRLAELQGKAEKSDDDKAEISKLSSGIEKAATEDRISKLEKSLEVLPGMAKVVESLKTLGESRKPNILEEEDPYSDEEYLEALRSGGVLFPDALRTTEQRAIKQAKEEFKKELDKMRDEARAANQRNATIASKYSNLINNPKHPHSVKTVEIMKRNGWVNENGNPREDKVLEAAKEAELELYREGKGDVFKPSKKRGRPAYMEGASELVEDDDELAEDDEAEIARVGLSKDKIKAIRKSKGIVRTLDGKTLKAYDINEYKKAKGGK